VGKRVRWQCSWLVRCWSDAAQILRRHALLATCQEQCSLNTMKLNDVSAAVQEERQAAATAHATVALRDVRATSYCIPVYQMCVPLKTRAQQAEAIRCSTAGQLTCKRLRNSRAAARGSSGSQGSSSCVCWLASHCQCSSNGLQQAAGHTDHIRQPVALTNLDPARDALHHCHIRTAAVLLTNRQQTEHLTR
jgi:hypothetical protein